MDTPTKKTAFIALILVSGLLGLGFVRALKGGSLFPNLFATISGVPAAATTTSPIAMPQEVRAIYITASTAGSKKRVEELITFVHKSGMNAIVVNIKDGDGVYLGSGMKEFVERLKKENIYSIARMVVFQDNYFAKLHPEFALKTASSTLWIGKGYAWIDPSVRKVWEYNAEIALRALNDGFSEINLDYVRFPADGNLNDIVYPAYDGNTKKQKIIADFSAYMKSRIKERYPERALSLDVFAYSLLTDGDVGIGQRFADLIDSYDAIAPMVYPSHFSPGNFEFENPAEEPYEVVLATLQNGIFAMNEQGKHTIIRPWLQDFNMGAVYNREKIQAEIRAVRDAGLTTGWMMWNPSNRYDISKYETK
ncbi:MAG: putative glycoside hydrolase [Candidatus Paceibacterota bacterium]